MKTLIPRAAQQVVDKGGYIADVDAAVLVAVGARQVDAAGVAAQEVVDQDSDIADVHVAIAVHITHIFYHLDDIAEIWIPIDIFLISFDGTNGYIQRPARIITVIIIIENAVIIIIY